MRHNSRGIWPQVWPPASHFAPRTAGHTRPRPPVAVQQLLASVTTSAVTNGHADGSAPTVRATWHAGGRDLEAEWMRERANEPEVDPFG